MIFIQFHVHHIMILTSIQMTLEESASHPSPSTRGSAPSLRGDIAMIFDEALELGALPLAEGEGVRSTLLQGHMN